MVKWRVNGFVICETGEMPGVAVKQPCSECKNRLSMTQGIWRGVTWK